MAFNSVTWEAVGMAKLALEGRVPPNRFCVCRHLLKRARIWCDRIFWDTKELSCHEMSQVDAVQDI